MHVSQHLVGCHRRTAQQGVSHCELHSETLPHKNDKTNKNQIYTLFTKAQICIF